MVLDNEFGEMEVDADLKLRGQFESPRVLGTVTVANGELNVDEILDRTLFRPYSAEAAGRPCLPMSTRSRPSIRGSVSGWTSRCVSPARCG